MARWLSASLHVLRLPFGFQSGNPDGCRSMVIPVDVAHIFLRASRRSFFGFLNPFQLLRTMEGPENQIYVGHFRFTGPKLEVPTMYQAYVRATFQRICLQIIWFYLVQWLQFKVLKFPLTCCATACWIPSSEAENAAAPSGTIVYQ